MKWFLIIVDQKLFCRYYSGEPIGCDNGQDCSGVMTFGASSSLLGGIWSLQPCTFLVPMDGYRLGLLVSHSQGFTSCFVISVSVGLLLNVGGHVLGVRPSHVIIGLILPLCR
jgi:hypothetical protein